MRPFIFYKLPIHSRRHNFLYLCVFSIFLLSMGHWVGWDGRETRITFVLGIIIFSLVIVANIRLNKCKRNVLSYIFLILACLFTKELTIGTILSFFFPGFLVIMLNDNDRVRCFEFIYKWFAVLLIPSMFAYLIYLMGSLPSVGRIMVNSNDIYHPLWYLLRDNHLILITFPLQIQEGTSRFCSMFIEPGHLGMMCAFLLFACRFEMKNKTTWVILAASLLTMSLTAYMLTFGGYVLSKYIRGELSVKFLFLFLLFVTCLYLFGSFYNNGNNLFNEYIIRRLQPDEENGIAGNNRVFGQIDMYLITMLTDIRLMLFGYDKNTLESLLLSGSGGTGLKMFLVSHGILGFIAVFSFYICYSIMSRIRRVAFGFLLFVFLLFFQRSCWDWLAWIICYTYGITYYEQNVTSRKQIRKT